MQKTRPVLLFAVLALVGCPSGPSDSRDPHATPDRPEGGATATDDAASPAPDDDGGPPADSGPTPTPAPTPTAGRCVVNRSGFSLDHVVDVDVATLAGTPIIAAVIERRRSSPLMMEGDAGLPALRSLYLIEPLAEGEPRVTFVMSDPGPYRDPFDRLAYERLAAVRLACHGGGCLLAAAVERRTPDTAGSAFTVAVALLDDSRELQGTPRKLAQEPDRGESLTACLGASDEGFVLGTAVAGGRGRLMWLDRRATPLDVRYVQGGFASCSARPVGLRVRVAMNAAAGVTISELGAATDTEGGAGGVPPAAPEPPEGATLAGLATVGGTAAIVASTGDGVVAARPGGGATVHVFDEGASAVHGAETGDGLVVVAVLGGHVAVARLGGDLAVAARSTGLGDGDAVWALAGEETTRVAWRDDGALHLRALACGPSPTAGEGEARSISASALSAADRGGLPLLRAEARDAGERQAFRAGWLFERIYHLDEAEITALRDGAARLTGIRYTQAARRLLTRLSEIETTAARSLLRSTCRDSDFERQWRSGEYQRITGCAAPPERTGEEDAGPEPPTGDEGTSNAAPAEAAPTDGG